MVRLLVCVNKQSIKQLLDLAFAVGSLTLTQPCLFHRSPKPPSIIVLIYQVFFIAHPPLQSRINVFLPTCPICAQKLVLGGFKLVFQFFLCFALFSVGDGLFK